MCGLYGLCTLVRSLSHFLFDSAFAMHTYTAVVPVKSQNNKANILRLVNRIDRVILVFTRVAHSRFHFWSHKNIINKYIKRWTEK